jgi:hypothetical protein
MQITKRGTPRTEREWVGVCNACSSEATALESELMNIQPSDYKTKTYSWEVCPVCDAGRDKSSWGGMLFHLKR